MSDIGRLFRKRGWPGQEPRENFTTEALAIAIAHDDRPMRRALGATQWPADAAPLDAAAITAMSAATQEYLPAQPRTPGLPAARSGYLDLALTLTRPDAPPVTVWVEAKIDAPESKDQLDAYAEHARRRAVAPMILILSRAPLREGGHTRNGTPIGWLPWGALADAVENTSPHDAWWSDLIVFLREEYVVRSPLPRTPIEPEPYIRVLQEVNKLIRERWPRTTMGWAQPGKLAIMARAIYQGDGRIISTGGPLSYGLWPIDGAWYWSIRVGSYNYQRVPLDAAELVQQADAGGLPDAWRRQTHPGAALEKRIRLEDLRSPEDAVAWFAQSLDEIQETCLLRDFIRGLAASQAAKTGSASGG